ncbi:hypothetical protein ACIQI7_15805 [Kitasatospora sp. NPDC092039]|uniref:hypothetical protein n=1 Tax=Kitasatospora sp. NPDC092039 TaxID=3364086 RepID=UPI0037FFF683
MGVPPLRHLKAPELPFPGAGKVVLLAGLATGRPAGSTKPSSAGPYSIRSF